MNGSSSSYREDIRKVTDDMRKAVDNNSEFFDSL